MDRGASDMSLSRGLVVKSGRLTLSQWRDRALASRTVVAPGVGVWYGVPANGTVYGDVNAVSFTVEHNSGFACNGQVRVVAEGVSYDSAVINFADVTTYYVYRDATADALLVDTNDHLIGGLVPWYAYSMEFYMRRVAGPVLANLEGNVRLQSL